VDSTEPNHKLVEDFDGELENVSVTEDGPTEIDETTEITEEIEITIKDLDAVVTVNPNTD
jgi:hypothetical protein